MAILTVTPDITRVDVERVTDTFTLIRFWKKGWDEDRGVWDTEIAIEMPFSMLTLLDELTSLGFTCTQHGSKEARCLRGEITRIDIFADPGGTWTMRKYPYGWKGTTHPLQTKSLTEAEKDIMIDWLKRRNWTLRFWPGGYRAFLGSPKPVRNAAAIKSMREKSGVHASMTYNFAFDY